MNIIALSDIHGSVNHLPALSDKLAGADLILIAGDITNFGGEPQAHKVLFALSEYNGNIFAVHGNCDTCDVEEYLDIHQMALDCRCIRNNGITLTGLGGALHYNGATPNESPEEQFARQLEGIKANLKGDTPVVFVSHQPAFGTKLDSVGNGKHAGSESIRNFIEDTEPLLAISGHIHDAAGIDRINETTLINPGPFTQGLYATITIENNRIENAEIHSLR